MPDDNFDEFVAKLQEEINEEALKEYNGRIVELFKNPKNWGKPSEDEISAFHIYEGPCGDTMHFFLKITDDIIEKANFTTDGCGASVAAGCQTTLLIEGKTIEYAENLTPEDIDQALDGLPDDHKHCAELCVRTLTRLIEKYRYT